MRQLIMFADNGPLYDYVDIPFQKQLLTASFTLFIKSKLYFWSDLML